MPTSMAGSAAFKSLPPRCRVSVSCSPKRGVDVRKYLLYDTYLLVCEGAVITFGDLDVIVWKKDMARACQQWP